jgi:hypothetical protein
MGASFDPPCAAHDLVSTVNIGASRHTSGSTCNGFPPAEVVHENR